jgi:TATA-box binding protein (TBP) (component of TFIID and TFIIIB)
MNPMELDDKAPFSATPFKISTITATGSINADVDLKLLFEHLPIITQDSSEKGVIFIEYGSSKNEVISRGVHYKKKPRQQNAAVAKDHKRFDNQATMIIKMTSEASYFVNAKMFKNGNVQMTGIKRIDDGVLAIGILIQVIQEMLGYTPSLNIVSSPEKMMNCNYEIRLINSDFRVNFEIKRELLHLCLTEHMGNKCTYEPCIYPGVKLQYFWNKNSAQPNGNCECVGGHCVGKGKGAATSECKKITIAIFQSGCVIITGASSEGQITECYQYICNVLQTQMNHIKKRKFVPLSTPSHVETK